MINITSLDNKRIKDVCRLRERKGRKSLGKYVTEGYRNVKDSLPYLIGAEIYVSESSLEKYSAEFNVDVVCADNVFAKLTDTENSQGILCVSDVPEDKFDDGKDCVYLDGISDPGNAGTILRTCLATGFDNVVFADGVDCYNPKVVRSAMSAVCKLNISSNSGEVTLAGLKEKGYTIICADMSGKNLFECNIEAQKKCLIIGSEANGVSKEAKALADLVVSLPMGKIESLNAAVCASVMMYQLKYDK
ncbi:MAG: TrmH family RNA methyltransferase [Candidatus Neoclostridium sp.]